MTAKVVTKAPLVNRLTTAPGAPAPLMATGERLTPATLRVGGAGKTMMAAVPLVSVVPLLVTERELDPNGSVAKAS